MNSFITDEFDGIKRSTVTAAGAWLCDTAVVVGKPASYYAFLFKALVFGTSDSFIFHGYFLSTAVPS